VVPGILVLVGKVAFLICLYGFLLVVYRGLLAEAQRGGRPVAARDAGARPTVERWELRPPASGPAMLRPGAPPAGARAVPPATSAAAPAAAASAAAGAVVGAALGAAATATPAPPQVAPEAPPEAPEAAAPVVPAMLRESRPREAAPEAAPPPRALQPVAALVVLTAPEAGLPGGQRVTLSEVVRLGRGDDNQVVLRDRFVSSHHAEITQQGGGHVLRDLGSTNGTFRNGARVSREVLLQDGDRIGIGTSMFTFHAH
jgi:hypothetical protein